VPELKDSAYNGVTIKQALMMRSGIDYSDDYDFAKPSLPAILHMGTLVRERIVLGEVAKIVPRAYPPGTHFNYSTLETVVLGRVLANATGETISDYMSEHLWKPAGMEADGYWIMVGPEGKRLEFNGAGFNARLRDYARFGLMMLHNGKANGRQVVPASWVAEATQYEGSTQDQPGYQYQWWKVPGGQRAYMAVGLLGQYIFIDPDTDTVVVKLSHYPPGNDDKVSQEAVAFMKAVSAWTPGR
jgi:CubicO group peptidase (beta-lactamase class C family)